MGFWGEGNGLARATVGDEFEDVGAGAGREVEGRHGGGWGN